jgi:transcriptional regulator with XRE-family HTH domain
MQLFAACVQRYAYEIKMSTTSFNTSLNIYSDAYSKYLVVNTQSGETLADYVRRVRVQVKDFSLSEVERNSNGDIDGSYVSRIENGLVKNVTPEKLKALARGLRVPEDEIFAVARGKTLGEAEVFVSEIYALFEGFEQLPDTDKIQLMPTIKMLSMEIQRRLQRAGITQPSEQARKIYSTPLSQGRNSQVRDKPRKIHSNSLGSTEDVKDAVGTKNESGGRSKRRR